MSHQVLSRKYRPQAFDELRGQDHIGRILRNTLTSGRVGHAYLFVGPRGVGKTTTARIFAKALNCARRAEAGASAPDAVTPEPCGACPSCRDIAAGLDLDVVEMDAASNNAVDDVRRLREQVGYATVRSPHRIWIVDEVHMLSTPAFNAFLKTLEEPPDGVKFIFCTTEEHKLPDTFRSRCQRVEFRPIDEATMAARLEDLAAQEGVALEEGLAVEIAAAALGGLRDAESLLEQLLAACPGGPIRRADLDALAGRAPRALLDGLLGAVETGDAAVALDAVDACLASGSKPGVLLEQWLEALRNNLVTAARAPADAAGGRERPMLARIARSMDVLLRKQAHLKAGTDGVLVCQLAAVELARLPHARDVDALLAALRATPAGAGPGGEMPPTVPGAPGGRGAPVRPSPPPPAAPPASPRSGPGDPPPLEASRVAEQWPALLEAAERADGRLAQVLARVQPGDVANGVVALRVAADDAMARSALERREAVLAFRRISREVFGRELAPRLDVAPPGAAAAPRAEPTEHPQVRLVTDLTGGRLLNLERVPARAPDARRDDPPES
ncbi:MAG: DNA polymerase III subunit gamma/tau [Planctomycetota bacterium]